MKNPTFTVILVHFQGATSDDLLLRGVDCILNQTFKDFEFLLYHNGPLLDESIVPKLAERGAKFICLEKNFNDSGYESRHRAMMEASGEYIVHFNSDNELYPNALENISKRITPISDVIIFPIWTTFYRNTPSEIRFVLAGIPPVENEVDAMQAVIRRSVWLENGGWTDRTPTGDGTQIQRFAWLRGFVWFNMVLGEHH